MVNNAWERVPLYLFCAQCLWYHTCVPGVLYSLGRPVSQLVDAPTKSTVCVSFSPVPFERTVTFPLSRTCCMGR